MWKNFLLTGLILCLSAGIFYVSVFNLDPLGEQKSIAFGSFFVSFFCGAASFFTFVFFFATELFLGKKVGTSKFLLSLRRGILVSVFFTLLLVLQFFRLSGLLEMVLLAIFLALVEWILVSAKKV